MEYVLLNYLIDYLGCDFKNLCLTFFVHHLHHVYDYYRFWHVSPILQTVTFHLPIRLFHFFFFYLFSRLVPLTASIAADFPFAPQFIFFSFIVKSLLSRSRMNIYKINFIFKISLLCMFICMSQLCITFINSLSYVVRSVSHSIVWRLSLSDNTF